ncbi:PD-(D/E)XK nuclease family protein [Fibrella sp. HMF5335]|uniref:PD-(D/E)XK nuclease family protein n=1 Tax=Fibrella rubiginis TaxID=2817060 RepID=A0A939GGS1_9BACT|nr:PD-(D/E)XK nuclease family protein [Fibrella rubiginis]MBO0936486.1 PD-(D/E)XK nuclease family protein [Fibrella rubiginis]
MKWSHSTSNVFRQCRRKYFFSDVLPAHRHSNALRRKAFELKNMQDLTMWAGSVVDAYLTQEIIPSIAQGQPLDFESFAEAAVQLANAQFDFSSQGLYANQTKEAAGMVYCILDIHEINQPYESADVDAAYATIRQAILNIPRLRMPDNRQSLLEFLQQAYSLRADVTNRYMRVEEAYVCPQIDLIAYVNGKPVVIDWKVSLSPTSDYARQLIIIGLAILRHRNLVVTSKQPYEYSDIRLLEVNLIKDGGHVWEHAFTQERANDILDDINLSSGDITQLTKDRLPKEIPITDFPGLEYGGYLCDTCPFYALCTHLNQHNNEYDEEAYAEFVRAYQCA